MEIISITIYVYTEAKIKLFTEFTINLLWLKKQTVNLKHLNENIEETVEQNKKREKRCYSLTDFHFFMCYYFFILLCISNIL